MIEPPNATCSCCGGALHVIGEDTSERLDKIPAKLRVLVTRRPKYACRWCRGAGYVAVAGVIGTGAARLVEGGIPTEALVADVLVSKYADHLPLYRQARVPSRDSVNIDRSTLCHWVGFAAVELEPLHARMVELLKSSSKYVLRRDALPCARSGARQDKNRLPVGHRARRPTLGWRRTTRRCLHLRARPRRRARRVCSPGSAARCRSTVMMATTGSQTRRVPAAPWRWPTAGVHFRRKFYDIAKGGHSPIALTEALDRIGAPVPSKPRSAAARKPSAGTHGGPDRSRSSTP